MCTDWLAESVETTTADPPEKSAVTWISAELDCWKQKQRVNAITDCVRYIVATRECQGTRALKNSWPAGPPHLRHHAGTRVCAGFERLSVFDRKVYRTFPSGLILGFRALAEVVKTCGHDGTY